MFFHPILETKLVMFSTGFAKWGISLDTLIFTVCCIFLDYVLRFITAGLTFKYSNYPSGISQKTINVGIWVSSIISIFLSLIFIF